MFPGLQRVRGWAGQAPGYPGGCITKIDLTADAALRHRLHNCGAKPAPLRRRDVRPPALGPAHGKDVAVGAPVDIDTAYICRERAVFPRIGAELMKGKPDGLRGNRVQAQPRAVHDDTRTNE